MFTLNQTVARLLIICAAIGVACVIVNAQTPQMNAQEQRIYDSIDCSQWTYNPDGSWDTGPNARLGGMVFSNSKHIRLSGNIDDGIDTADVLLSKCGKR
jgi:hypothetical protein